MRQALILLTALAALTACVSAPAERPGSQAVYDRIDGLTDCTQLQTEFDTASANYDRAEAGSSQALAATAYMKAADARMKEVGCY